MTVRQPPVARGEIVAARSGRTVGALRHSDGELLWTREGTDDDRSPLVGTDRSLVVVTARGEAAAHVAVLDWSEGREIWTGQVPGFPGGCAASSDGRKFQLLTSTDTTTLVHEFDLGTGKLSWSQEVAPACRDLLVNDGYTLLGGRDLLGDDGGLYRLTHDSGDLERLLPNDVWSLHPGEIVDVVSLSDFRAHEDGFILAVAHGSGEPGWRQRGTRDLVATDGSEVVCLEESGSNSTVVLREALSGEEIWRTDPLDFFEAGKVFFTGDSVGVMDVIGLWFVDRQTGEELGLVEFDGVSSGALVVTSAGVVISSGNGLACLGPA